MVDHINPKRTRIRFTNPGVADGKQATINPKMARGSMQYPMTLIDWKIDLYLMFKYPLLPRSLQLTLAKKDPIQKMRKTLTKES